MPRAIERYRSLSGDARRHLHLRLAEDAEKVWRAYVEAEKMEQYVETAAGSIQTIDRELPADAIEAVRRGTDHAKVAQRYREPIVAMQDEDLYFNERADYAYYAVYNLYRYYFGGLKDDWLIVNQALSAHASEPEALLEKYLREVE